MAQLPCDECGASTDTHGSCDTPIKILCEKCSEKEIDRSCGTCANGENCGKYIWLRCNNMDGWVPELNKEL